MKWLRDVVTLVLTFGSKVATCRMSDPQGAVPVAEWPWGMNGFVESTRDMRRPCASLHMHVLPRARPGACQNSARSRQCLASTAATPATALGTMCTLSGRPYVHYTHVAWPPV